MSEIIQLISLFNTFLFGWSLVVIGNYSELNPKDCGISRLSSEMGSVCFKWHKHIDPQLIKGKNVTIGDAPWMALIKFKQLNYSDLFNINSYSEEVNLSCSGSLFANQWILTAAHCMRSKSIRDIRIYLGYDFTRDNTSDSVPYFGTQIFLHPKYTNANYDLALIKMDRPIDRSLVSINRVNNICLPQKWINYENMKYEYVMFGGWGGPTGMLKMAYWRMSDISDPFHKRLFPSIALTFKLEHQGPCKGDSGGPFWQYTMGRAVIVAVFSKATYPDRNSLCSDIQENADQGDIDGADFSIWVDSEIDWIKNVTKLN